jgi:PAS domain S-box-containing protein
MRVKLHLLIGALLIVLGATVMVGWFLHAPQVVRLLPALPAMVVNTALAFVLAGAALMLIRPDSSRATLLASSAASLLVALTTLVLAEHLIQADPGIDHPAWHAWLVDANTQPGRMSWVTAAAFLLGGVALLVALRWPGRPPRRAVQLLTGVVGAIGGLAIAGHLVNARLLFPGYFFADLALHTATGLLFLAFGMAAAWRQFDWGRAPLFENDRDRITFTGATILVLIALGAGVLVFAILQGRFQTLTRDNLLSSLTSQAQTFEDIISLREIDARIAATRPAVLRNLRVIQSGHDDGSNLANVKAVIAGLLEQGFSGLAYFGIDGKAVASGGGFVSSPVINAALNTADRARLLWDHGFVLRHHIRLDDADGSVGAVAVEQRLPELTRSVSEMMTRGQTWDMGLCTKDHELLTCFPQRLTPQVFSITMADPSGAARPMTRALHGETGSTVTRDYRDQNVVAAFGPIGRLGLGLVVKVDAAELFQPIREQMLVAAGLLALLASAGTWLLRRRLAPLVKKLVDAEAQARSQERRFRDLLESAPDAIVITDLDGRIALVNSQTEKMFGHGRAEMLGKAIEMLLPDRFHERHRDHRANYGRDAHLRPMGAGLDLQGLRKDGSEFPTEILLSPLKTDDGILISAAIRDVTRTKDIENLIRASLKEKDALLQEIHHRVKNNLQIIASLLSLQSAYISDPQMLLKFQESQQRIRAMALIHEKLYQSETLAKVDLADYVQSLVAILVRTYTTGSQIGLEIQVDPATVAIDTAIPVGLMLNELVTNALKYAYPNGRTGKLMVSLRAESSGFFILRVQDDGGGLPPDFQLGHVGTLGLRLVRMFAKQLRAEVTLHSEPGQLSFEIRFQEQATPSP